MSTNQMLHSGDGNFSCSTKKSVFQFISYFPTSLKTLRIKVNFSATVNKIIYFYTGECKFISQFKESYDFIRSFGSYRGRKIYFNISSLSN